MYVYLYVSLERGYKLLHNPVIPDPWVMVLQQEM